MILKVKKVEVVLRKKDGKFWFKQKKTKKNVWKITHNDVLQKKLFYYRVLLGFARETNRNGPRDFR